MMLMMPLWATAQADFTADRPGATTGTDVLPAGRVQWETGVAWERSKLDGPAVTTWTVNNTLLRWGFSDYAELRLQGDFLASSASGAHHSGFSDVAIGTKVKLLEGRKALPSMSLLANILVPGGSDANYLPREWGAQVGLLFQNELTSRLSLGYEGDLIWSDDSQPTAFYGVCLGYALNDRLSLALEEYNNTSSDGTECWTEISFGWQVSPRLQLDMGTDISLSHPADYHNLMIGLAWQMTKK